MRPCDPDHIRVDDWGAFLRVHEPVRDATFVGIRAHHIELLARAEAGNTLPCEVLGAVESPFEVTVYLRVNNAAIEAELPRSEWPRPVNFVRFDPRHLLLLRE
jgi:molybdate transport system permease protein